MRAFLPAAAALAAALVLPAPVTTDAASAQRTAPAARDWTRNVVTTPLGGYRMGNPAARVKLVEYGSISCPHCAEFARVAGGPLRTYVRSGRVSWEYRPFLIFPTDPGLTMLLRCRGPAQFFELSDALYADQPNWSGRVQNLPAETVQRLQSMELPEMAGAIVRAGGLDRFFRARGMTDAQINACLTDRAGLDAIANVTRRASQQEGVSGTPTFFINGVLAPTNVWSGLEPLIRRAGG